MVCWGSFAVKDVFLMSDLPIMHSRPAAASIKPFDRCPPLAKEVVQEINSQEINSQTNRPHSNPISYPEVSRSEPLYFIPTSVAVNQHKSFLITGLIIGPRS